MMWPKPSRALASIEDGPTVPGATVRMPSMHSPLRLSSEVAEALRSGRAIVALESTLIAHGLPWPDNLETARASEAAVRSAGAVPATVAVLGGTPVLGLSNEELERVARSVIEPARAPVRKAGRRDLSAVMASGSDAATTVSATLFLARSAGIGVMATGGLGGVHRDAGQSFDVSNDLDELSRGDGCLVVCSGVKSILDVPATLEVLETAGVAVVGYGTGEFPAFTTRSSGQPVEVRAYTPTEAAALVRAHRILRLPGSVVLAQPVPEEVALDGAEMEKALAEALAEAKGQGVSGKAITPFLLSRIREATGGRSLTANTALIVNNAFLAGQVAAVLADRKG